LDTLIIAGRDWLETHLQISRAVAERGAAEIFLIAFAYGLAKLLRRLTVAWTDGLVASINPWLRNPRIMAALRPLATALIWWAFVLFASLLFAALGYAAYPLHIAASLLLAWIIIRTSSALLRDPSLSYAVAIVVWVIAAIDIVGLGDAAVAALDRFAITIGTLRLSPLVVIKATLLMSVLLWAATAAARMAQLRINRITTLTPSIQVLISNFLRIALIVLAVIVALDAVGVDLSAFALFSGAVGVGIGFGLQKVVANFVSGVILLLDRSIKPGDVIEIEQTFGQITSMGARFVSVKSRDGKDYLLPNEDLITHRVINWSYSNRLVRLDLPFGVAYGSDLRLVRAFAIAAAESVPRVIAAPPPVCHPTALGESAINFLLRFWIDDPNDGVTNIKGEVLLAVYDKLTAAGIEFPFPRYDVRLRGERAGEIAQSAAPQSTG
jgi:small-conductance mechanosensitive channel